MISIYSFLVLKVHDPMHDTIAWHWQYISQEGDFKLCLPTRNYPQWHIYSLQYKRILLAQVQLRFNITSINFVYISTWSCLHFVFTNSSLGPIKKRHSTVDPEIRHSYLARWALRCVIQHVWSVSILAFQRNNRCYWNK